MYDVWKTLVITAALADSTDSLPVGFLNNRADFSELQFEFFFHTELVKTIQLRQIMRIRSGNHISTNAMKMQGLVSYIKTSPRQICILKAFCKNI